MPQETLSFQSAPSEMFALTQRPGTVRGQQFAINHLKLPRSLNREPGSQPDLDDLD